MKLSKRGTGTAERRTENLFFPSSATPSYCNIVKKLHSEQFHIDIDLQPSALKMEAVFYTETLVSTYRFTRRYNPDVRCYFKFNEILVYLSLLCFLLLESVGVNQFCIICSLKRQYGTT
jgi:hypothetical protein